MGEKGKQPPGEEKGPGTQRSFFFFFCKDSECGLQSGAIAVVWGAEQVTMGPRQGDQGARRVGGTWDGLRSHNENDNSER